MNILNLVRKLIFRESSEENRREKLFKIIGPHIQDWTAYADVADIVKQESPGVYKWGTTEACRYMSSEFMDDLEWLCSNKNYIMENEHFRRSDARGYCTTAYKLTYRGRAVLKEEQSR